jgi:hypothetical protein
MSEHDCLHSDRRKHRTKVCVTKTSRREHEMGGARCQAVEHVEERDQGSVYVRITLKRIFTNWDLKLQTRFN